MYEAMRRRPRIAPRTARGGRHGFTLVELLVGVSLMLVITFAALGLLEIAQRSEPEIRESNERSRRRRPGWSG